MSTTAGMFGLIFDMDGVLIDSADAHFESWRRTGGERGVDVSPESFAGTFGRPNSDIIPILFGIDSPQDITRIANRKETLYREIVRENMPIVPGAVELVRELHRRGARLAIGSSGPRRNVNLVLQAMGVSALMTTIVSGEDVVRGKPDPEVFSKCCRQLDLPPARCVVIEDAPAGVEAAVASGARVVAILKHHPRSAFENADVVVARLDELTVADLVSLAQE